MKHPLVKKFTGPIPDPTGTGRTGKHEELPTRRKLEEDLSIFIKNCSPDPKIKGPLGMILLGEWGDGKTELFESLVHPKAEENGDRSIYVSGTTVLSAYKMTQVKKWIETTSLEAEKFIVALLFALRDHGPVRREYLPEPPLDAKNARELIAQWLDKIYIDFGGSLIIFLDEFEEFLPHNEGLRRTIMGIRSLLSKDLVLGSKNEYINRFHLIIACTPAAYYRLQNKKVVSEVLGGFKSRLRAIEMGRIPEIESMNFLFSLLLQAWEYNIPDVPPISSPGVLLTLVRVSQGNLRYMTAFFGQLLQNEVTNGNLRQIDGITVLDFLKLRHLSIYGGETQAIDQEFYRRFFEAIEDLKSNEEKKIARELITLLLGELQPIEIAQLIEREVFPDIDSAVMKLNRLEYTFSRRLGVNKSFLRFREASQDLSIDEMIENGFGILGGRIETSGAEKIYIVGLYEEPIELIKEKLCYYTLDYSKNTLKRIPLVPAEKTDWKSLFPELQQSQISDLYTKFNRDYVNGEKDNIFIGITKEVELRLFAPPVPPGLEYIPNRENRFLLWREVNSKSSDLISKYFPKSIFKYLELISQDQSKFIKFEAISKSDEFIKFKISLTPDSKPFKGLAVLSTNRMTSGQVKSLIDKTKDFIEEKIVFIFLTDSLSDNAREIIELKNKQEFPNKYVLIDLSSTLSRKLLAAILAKEKHIKKDIDIDVELWKVNVEKLLYLELGLEKRLSNWISTQKDNGAIIPLFNLEDPTALANAFGFLAKGYSLSQSACSIESAWKTVREEWKDGFSDYGMGGTSLSPADETELYVFKHSPYLLAGKFIKSDSEEIELYSKYGLKINAVQNRIIHLISEESMTVSSLSKKFIEETSVQNLLKAYVESLRTLGMISPFIDKRVTGKTKLSIVNQIDWASNLTNNLDDLEEGYNSLSIPLSFRVLTTMKQKDHKNIFFQDFFEKIKRYFDQISNISDKPDYDYQISQKSLGLSCLNVLISIANEWLQRLRAIQHELNSQQNEMKMTRESLRTQVKQLLQNFKSKGIKISNIDDILEVEEMEEAWKRYLAFFDEEIKPSKIITEMNNIYEKFGKRKADSEEKRIYFYNLTPNTQVLKNLKRWSLTIFYWPLVRKLDLTFSALNEGIDSINISGDESEIETIDPLIELSKLLGSEGKPSEYIESYLRNFFQSPIKTDPGKIEKHFKYSLKSILNILEEKRKKNVESARSQTIKIERLREVINNEIALTKSQTNALVILENGITLFRWHGIEIPSPQWKEITDLFRKQMQNLKPKDEHSIYKKAVNLVNEKITDMSNSYDETSVQLKLAFQRDADEFLSKFKVLINETIELDSKERKFLTDLVKEIEADYFKLNLDVLSQFQSSSQDLLADLMKLDQEELLTEWKTSHDNFNELNIFFARLFDSQTSFEIKNPDKSVRDIAFQKINEYDLENLEQKRMDFKQILTQIKESYETQVILLKEFWKATIINLEKKSEALKTVSKIINQPPCDFPILLRNKHLTFVISEELSPIQVIEEELHNNERIIKEAASKLGLGGNKIIILLEIASKEKFTVDSKDIDNDLKELIEKGYISVFATFPLTRNKNQSIEENRDPQ